MSGHRILKAISNRQEKARIYRANNAKSLITELSGDTQSNVYPLTLYQSGRLNHVGAQNLYWYGPRYYPPGK